MSGSRLVAAGSCWLLAGYLQFGDQGGPVVVETVDRPRRFSFRWNYPAGEEPVTGNSMLVDRPRRTVAQAGRGMAQAGRRVPDLGAAQATTTRQFPVFILTRQD